MMSNTHKKLVPIGSNMNDAAYPFRGQHKLEDCINHGHSGVTKKFPTSIGMRITGSNLVIEQVQTPKGIELECELGVDGGIPRPVSLQQASALMVPGDGHDYNLTATVRANGATSKHYCKLTFNGSEGTNVLRVRAPEDCHPDAIYIVADGRRLRPTAGWFRIPVQTKECALVANIPATEGGEGGANFPYNPSFPSFLPQRNGTANNGSRRGSAGSPLSPQQQQQQQQRRQSPPRHGSVSARESTIPADAQFFLETIPAPPPSPESAAVQQPLLVCTSTGHVIPLTPHGTVAVPHAGAPFRLLLPARPSHDGSGNAFPNAMAVTPNPTAPGAATGPAAIPEIETRIQPASSASTTSSPPPPIPVPLNGVNGSAAGVNAGPAVAPITNTSSNSALPSFVVSAPHFTVQVVGEDGSTATGQGMAALPLSHRRAQTIQITVKDAQGNVVARQKSHVPALQSAPATLQLKDDASGNLVVAAAPGSQLSVGGVPQANAAAGAVLPRVVPQQITVEQPNADGTVSTLALEVSAKASGTGLPLGGNGGNSAGPVPVPIPLGGSPAPTATAQPPAPAPAAAAPEKWVMELCTALQKSSPEEQRRLTQAIQPSTLPGMTIVNFVRDQLTRQPPAISFTVSKNGLDAVQCPGCTVTATVGSDPPRNIPNFGSVQLTAGRPAMLTATSTTTQRPISACRVQMSANLSGDPPASSFAASPSAGYNPYGSATPAAAAAASTENRADTELVTRVLDSLIRHNVQAAQVAEELGGVSTAPFSAQGRRMLPLLTACLRSASANGAAGAAAKAASEQAAAIAAATAAAEAKASAEIFFTCGPGYVDNIYTNSPQLHLFAAVDDQTPLVLQQRGRVPAQGVLEGERRPFFVRLTARDPTTGEVRMEKTITVLGVAPPAAPVVKSAAAEAPVGLTGPPPTAPTPTNTAAAAATTPLGLLSAEGLSNAAPVQAAPDIARTEGSVLSNSAGAPAVSAAAAAPQTPMPYIDVSLQTVGQDVQARFLCPPHLRLVCDVDGVGGHTGLSDFVTKMPASRFHRVNLSLVDTFGKVVFQQKLDVPAMSSPVWGLAVQHNGLSVDPESGSLATASVDRSPECALQGNFLSFDASTPHYVYLRKYLNGIRGSCVGEVSLRLPGLTLPPELAEVTSILRRRANRQLGDAQAKAELQQLRPRCTSPAVAELISCLLDSWSSAGGPIYSVNQDSPSNRVFFRLTGSD